LIKNCYEAVNELEKLSKELEVLLDKNIKLDGKLDGRIDDIEREFLFIKKSLEGITVEGSDKSAYKLGLDMISYKMQAQTKDNDIKPWKYRGEQLEKQFKKLEETLKEVEYIKKWN
jgi:hypothetical protein